MTLKGAAAAFAIAGAIVAPDVVSASEWESVKAPAPLVYRSGPLVVAVLSATIEFV